MKVSFYIQLCFYHSIVVELCKFNENFGKKVADAFPKTHYYGSEAQQISKVHNQTKTLCDD